ncbi:MAG: hypothetical protein OEM52_09650 [bacterium]|nr:hypothetical protein [bacterium]
MRFMRYIAGLVIAMPFLILGFLILFWRTLGKDAPPPPNELYIVVVLLFVIDSIVLFFIRWQFKRMRETSVEISDTGIQHYAPGSPKTIPWQSVTQVKRIMYRKGQFAEQLIYPEGKYTLSPELVPDTPDAPSIKMTWKGILWLYPDGRTVDVTLENSFGHQAILRYRPDLLSIR